MSNPEGWILRYIRTYCFTFIILINCVRIPNIAPFIQFSPIRHFNNTFEMQGWVRTNSGLACLFGKYVFLPDISNTTPQQQNLKRTVLDIVLYRGSNGEICCLGMLNYGVVLDVNNHVQ